VKGSGEEPRAIPRGRLVEFVRLIFVLLFAAGGYTVATQVGSPTTTRTLLGVILGSGTGFVLGGVLGRQTASAVNEMEREFRRVPAPELVAGTIPTKLARMNPIPARATSPLEAPYAKREISGASSS